MDFGAARLTLVSDIAAEVLMSAVTFFTDKGTRYLNTQRIGSKLDLSSPVPGAMG